MVKSVKLVLTNLLQYACHNNSGSNTQATDWSVQAIRVVAEKAPSGLVGCTALDKLGGKRAFRVEVLEAHCITREPHLCLIQTPCHLL